MSGVIVPFSLREFWDKHSDAVYTAVITTVVVGGGSLFWTMNGSLASLSANVVAISDRLDRIAVSLPDLGIRIASESLLQNYGLAVVTLTDLTEGEKVILDFSKMEGQIWTAPSSLEGNTLSIRAILSGAVGMTSPSAFLFSELNSASVLSGREVMSPLDVDPEMSWVSTGQAAGFKEDLGAMGWAAGETFELTDIDGSNYAAILEQVRSIQ